MFTQKKTIIIFALLGLIFSSTKAALCVHASMHANQCLRCYQGILDASKKCVDPQTPVPDCANYSSDGVCVHCVAKFTRILEAQGAETPGSCIPAKIEQCIAGYKRLDAEFCHVCNTGFVPALGRKHCIAEDKTVQRHLAANCEWNYGHSRCARCQPGFGFSHHQRVTKYIRPDGSVRIIEHRHRYTSAQMRRRYECNKFPTDKGYDWSGCLSSTTRFTRTYKFTGYRTVTRYGREYRIPIYTRSESTETFCSLCDGLGGYFQPSDKASCKK